MPGLVPGIHALCPCRTKNPWMAGTSPAVTNGVRELDRSFRPARYDIIGKERSMPERMPVGQREVTVLSLV